MNLYEFLDRPIVVREPTSHPEIPDQQVCPECGDFITGSKGPTFAPTELIVEDAAREQLEDGYPQQFPTYGYRCTRHDYDVLTPVVVSNGWAPGFFDGWAGVPIRFADGAVRHIPVPATELGPVAPGIDTGGRRSEV